MPTNLRQALHESTRKTRWGSVADPVATDVLNSISYASLERALHENGIRDLKPLSGGVFSVVLDAGNNVVRLGYGTLEVRPPIPEVLQVLSNGQAGNLRYEILPKVDTASVNDQDLQAVLAALTQRGYHWNDAGLDNIGKHHGQIVIIDPEGIHALDRGQFIHEAETLATEWHATPSFIDQVGEIKAANTQQVIQSVGRGKFVVWPRAMLHGVEPAVDGKVYKIGKDGLVSSPKDKVVGHSR